MAHLKFELDRGYGWQVRSEGEVPDSTTLEQIKENALRLALNGPVRAILNGAQVFETPKLTKKQAEQVFGLKSR